MKTQFIGFHFRIKSGEFCFVFFLCFVFCKSFPKSASCFRLSLGLLALPRLQGQEGRDSMRPGRQTSGTCLDAQGLRLGPRGVNPSYPWQKRMSEGMPVCQPVPEPLLLQSPPAPTLGMLLCVQSFLSTNVSMRFKPRSGPASEDRRGVLLGLGPETNWDGEWDANR